jgi:hypothetical protein
MTTEERLENLERELAATRRRSRWLLGGLALGLGALALVWASAASVPKAEAQDAVGARGLLANELIIVDENGKVRAMLGVYAGGPSLGLYDENGKERATLGVYAGGPSLALRDENGKERATLGVYAFGPGLALRDENSKDRAMLVLKADGPELSLRDAAGRDRVALAVTAPGPWLCLYDAAGNGRASLGAGKTATPDGKLITHPESSLLFIGEDGKVSWSAP